MSTEAMTITGVTTTAEQGRRLQVAGQLGWDADSAIREKLVESCGTQWEGHKVEIDLSDVSFINSAGLSSLLSLHHDLDSRGGALLLTGVSPRIGRVFEVSGINGILGLSDEGSTNTEVQG